MGKDTYYDPTLPPGDNDSWNYPQPKPYDTVIKGTIWNDRPLKGGWDADEMYGYAGNDDIYGYGGADRIYAGSGNDTVDGGYGDDIIYGERGQDTIQGGAGNDHIFGGADSDYLLGGSGNDTFHFRREDQSTDPDVIFDFEAGDKIAIDYGHGTIAGTASNYAEFVFANASFDQMKAAADWAMSHAGFNHIFITDEVNGYLFSTANDSAETWVAFWGFDSLSDFDWSNIV